MRTATSRRAWIVAAAAALLLALAGPLASGAAAARCAVKTNVEAIVDDSGSMSLTDPDRLRVHGLELLLNALPASTTVGAIEFGSGLGLQPPADTLFEPATIGSARAAMERSLDTLIEADNGTTDYNAAFAFADAANPAAQARIFLTDGGHNEGEYANGHLAHDVPTYVVGFSQGLRAPEDQGRLEQIAAETGGHYYPLADSTQLQAVINSIGAELMCETPPQTFTDELASGTRVAHTVVVGGATRSVQIALTWASPRDRFKLTGLKLGRGGKAVAVAGRAGAPRQLQVTRQGSSTFALFEVSGLSRGNLRFEVSAVKIGSGGAKVPLTTQVMQRTKR